MSAIHLERFRFAIQTSAKRLEGWRLLRSLSYFTRTEPEKVVAQSLLAWKALLHFQPTDNGE